MSSPAAVQQIYRRRFTPDLESRRKLWRVLCRDFFQRYVPPASTVLEVGAGYCEFINAIHAERKVAVDLNPDTRRYADADVQVIETSSCDLSSILNQSIDVAFASNFFEHISREDILTTMREVARVLRPNGRFLILQPNIRYCARDFWMFFDHITPLDQYSLAEALEMSGFQVTKMIARFLPFTTKSRLPSAPVLVALYLRLPIIWRLMGQQSFAVARLDRSE